MYTIEYLPIARRDMVDIAKYIGVKLANPDAAERLAEKMVESAEDLANMPMCPAPIIAIFISLFFLFGFQMSLFIRL